MYDWSRSGVFMSNANKFQLLLKGCTIEASWTPRVWPYPTFQLLLKGCTIEAWKYVPCRNNSEFQLLLKGCTIEAKTRGGPYSYLLVSVVVERMYDWSIWKGQRSSTGIGFSCCWKDVRLKQSSLEEKLDAYMFQLLLKGCTIEAQKTLVAWEIFQVSVVVERMYDWSITRRAIYLAGAAFQLLLKGCTIEAVLEEAQAL